MVTLKEGKMKLNEYFPEFLSLYHKLTNEYERAINSPTLVDNFTLLTKALDEANIELNKCTLLFLDISGVTYYTIGERTKKFLERYEEIYSELNL